MDVQKYGSKFGCCVCVGYLAANVAAKVSRDMRKDVYKKVELFSNAEFDKFSTASLITRTTNDINAEFTSLLVIAAYQVWLVLLHRLS